MYGFTKYFFLLVFYGLITSSLDVHGQQLWRSAGTLVDNKSYKVTVEYLFSADACGQSRFRYQFTRRGGKKDAYVFWRFDYLNCDNELISKEVRVDLLATMSSGTLEDAAWVFPGNKVIKDIYGVLETEHPILRQSVKAVSSFSFAPKMIVGESIVDKGSTVTLTLKGGYLAPGSVWKWYQGACSGLSVDTGIAITVRPGRRTTYFVRAEGKNTTECMSFPVDVVVKNLAATGISGRDIICKGDTGIRLTAENGRLGEGGKWVWYEGDCNGRKIGEGESILVSPQTTTPYAVRAEGPTNITECQYHAVRVTFPSIGPAAIKGLTDVDPNAPVNLAVEGGTLAPDAKWAWYSGTPDALTKVGTGAAIVVYPTSSTTYYVRAEGVCNSTDFAAKMVKVKNVRAYTAHLSVPSSEASIFFNAGIVADDPSKLSTVNNLVVTIGAGKTIGWFIRAKLSTDQSTASFEAPNGAYIDNYNLPGYYQYNGITLSKRTAYTGDGYFGGSHVAIYLGGGYGTRELLWGVNQYSYGNAGFSTSWVKNVANSYAGWEAEGGLILKTGFLNLMGGVSTIQGKYTDYNLGVGVNF